MMVYTVHKKMSSQTTLVFCRIISRRQWSDTEASEQGTKKPNSDQTSENFPYAIFSVPLTLLETNL